MTILSLDTAVSAALKSGTIFSMDSSNRKMSEGNQSRPLPTRINLRKRSSGSNFHQMNLGTVNSAFLSGLFADVAQVTTEEDQPQQPSKKSKISKSKSLARCGRSFKQLVSVQEALGKASALMNSPVKANTSFFTKRQDSLHYQLDCVSSSSCSTADASSGGSKEGTTIAFPLLPSTVSNSSCNNNKQLTRVISDLQSSVTDTNSEKTESYGWFVEMEDENTLNNAKPAADPYAATTTAGVQGLAFQAPTAPKANNHDAEVEWAKAADTVDDVLGDFF